MQHWARLLLPAMALLVLQAGLAHAQTVEFVFEGDAPPALKIVALSDSQDTVGTRLTLADGKFAFAVPQNPALWRREPVFVITVPPRTLANGLTTVPLTLELAFSFRPMDTGTITVPFGLFNATGIDERQRIDSLPRHQRYDKILAAQALVQHYRSSLGDRAKAETQFMMTTWFDALYAAIVTDGRSLRLGGIIEDMVGPILAGDSRLARINASIIELKARPWRDKDLLPGLLEAGNCDAAKALVAFLVKLHDSDPGLARTTSINIGDPEAVLGDMDRQTGAACP
jgi:hypothetical protein